MENYGMNLLHLQSSRNNLKLWMNLQNILCEPYIKWKYSLITPVARRNATV